MTHIISLDDASMANRLQMGAIGKSLKAMMDQDVVLIHDCGEYTDALIQTGLMRREASVRAARELNRKLVTWFADYGISAIGVHGDQRGLVTVREAGLGLDLSLFKTYPPNTLRVVSTLVTDLDGQPSTLPLTEFITLFKSDLPLSRHHEASETLKNGFFR